MMFELLILIVVFAFLQSSRIRLGRRVDTLERQLVDLNARLQAVAALPPVTAAASAGAMQPIPAAAIDASVESEAAPAPEADQAGLETLQPAATAPEISTPAQETAAPAALPAAVPAPAVRAPALSLETLLGGHWAVWVGGIALALGGVLMARYAIETGLLSPAVRLLLAAGFGALLILAGEGVRRGALARIPALLANTPKPAMIPGILTAAGGVTLFASIYAAHQLYGFIGPASTFTALAAVAFLLIGLSLLHGQALAGLGLLGALAAPALVQSQAPDVPVLITYVFTVWLGTMLASRLRGWRLVPVLATLGAGGWALLAASLMPDSNAPVVFFLLAALLLKVVAADTPLFASGGPDGERAQRNGTAAAEAIAAALALTGMATASIYAGDALPLDDGLPWGFLLISAALFASFAFRRGAVIATLLTGLAATAGLGENLLESSGPLLGTAASTLADPGTRTAVLLGVITLAAAALAFLPGRQAGRFRERLSALAAIAPVGFMAMSWFDHGNWLSDPAHAVLVALFALALLAMTECLNRFRPAGFDRGAEGMLVTGAFAGLAAALYAVTPALGLTILWPLLGLGFLAAGTLRRWQALPFMLVASALPLALLVAFDPTIVGPMHLGTTPLFNALLPAYGGPALMFAFGAWFSRRLQSPVATRLLDGLAVLSAFLAIAVLVRHGMNHGHLTGGRPSLGEQSIYTLLLIGFSGVMTGFDRRNANPVFVWGSMIAGGLSMLLVLTDHLFVLNPYVSGELVGDWPLLNLLLPGYLLPGLAFSGVAVLSRQSRPMAYRKALGTTGGLLAFAWLTLSVRQLWQGTSLADWQGFLEGETYSYSLAWLLAGVALLALGARFNSVTLRYASAAVVMVTVVKVFLIDLSNLEGLLRAISFIGLGFVLIGIGLFYQRLLTRLPVKVPEENPQTPPSP